MKFMFAAQPMSDQLKAQCDRAFEKHEAARKRLKALRGDMDNSKKRIRRVRPGRIMFFTTVAIQKSCDGRSAPPIDCSDFERG